MRKHTHTTPPITAPITTSATMSHQCWTCSEWMITVLTVPGPVSSGIVSGTTATFQVNVPVAPTLVNSREATAGRLRVRVLEPANATINSNFSSGKYVEDGARYRIDVQGGTTGYVVELSEI